MMDSETIYTVVQIYEADFGCEERTEGQPLLAGVLLKSADGQEKNILQEDAFLYEKEINEGDKVLFFDGKLHKMV